ncbi:MAG: type II toxin-antitoxin system RelE/ParE family toxin [Panacagrimonas sp.]
MSYIVYVRQAAELDATEAQDWYEAQSPGLGAAFNEEFGRALLRLEEMPFTGQQMFGSVRRVVLHRFPFLLWYQVERSTVIVLACTHGKRSQRFIRSRLR